MKLAVIQSSLHWECPLENRLMFEEKIGQIANDTDIVLLPEMFTTGFSMNPERLAEEHPGETLEWMKGVAAQTGFALAGSIIVNENGDYYNRLYFVCPDGGITYYDKRHLFRMAGEDKHYRSGMRRVIVNYKGWRILLTVCYDLRFPVWSRNRNDYDILLIVANFPERRRYAWNSLLIARAIENQCYVAACNRTGVDGNGITYTGDSQLVDPMGRVMAKGESNTGEVVYATLSLEELERIREVFPVHLDSDSFTIEL